MQKLSNEQIGILWIVGASEYRNTFRIFYKQTN